MIQVMATLSRTGEKIPDDQLRLEAASLQSALRGARVHYPEITSIQTIPLTTRRGQFVNVYVTVDSDSPVLGDEVFDRLMGEAGFESRSFDGEVAETNGMFTARERELMMA